MTANPIDMQVMLPQTGQVNRVQRGLQKQQQTEEQILGQMLHQEIREKENTVKKSEQALHKNVKEEKERKKDNEKKKKAGQQREDDSSADEENNITKSEKVIGGHLDIRV